MKGEVSPPMLAVAAVLIVIVVGFLAWKMLGPGSKGGGSNPYSANSPYKTQGGAPPNFGYKNQPPGSGTSTNPSAGGAASGQ